MQKVYEPSEIAIWDSIYDIDNLKRIVEDSHAYLLLEKNLTSFWPLDISD